ncbi:G-box-binding factor 4-like [Salvia divinorum]|uniref:G-box-binding factor 4-like n=1 Tax=Salvia divinorum TaxID=28513 RepID=A0ABD1FNP9_SALDI
MASSEFMASSTSCDSDLKRKLSACASTSSTVDFLRIDSGSNVRDDLASGSVVLGGFLSNARVGISSAADQGHRAAVEAESGSSTLLNAEITLLDAAGAVTPISDGEREPQKMARKTVDDVWREIVAGKKCEKQPKEEMMTLEDFLAKAGEDEEDDEEDAKRTSVEVKEEGLSGRFYSFESGSGVIGGALSGGLDAGGLSRGRGRRSLSLLEPMDKAAQQRQRRMIKNRESAARSRERKQAYQVELESMAVRLEEEKEQLLKEKEERTKKRLKQLMENVIPVAEKRRPRRLQKVRSI